MYKSEQYIFIKVRVWSALEWITNDFLSYV